MRNFCVQDSKQVVTPSLVSKYIAMQTDELSTRNGKCNSKMSRNVHVIENARQTLQQFVVRQS